MRRFALMLIVLPLLSSIRQAQNRPWDPPSTFSILGYDPDTGEIGAAVQSRVFSVGNGVLWAEAGVGAVATQAVVDVSYGPKGIELLKKVWRRKTSSSRYWTAIPILDPPTGRRKAGSLR